MVLAIDSGAKSKTVGDFAAGRVLPRRFKLPGVVAVADVVVAPPRVTKGPAQIPPTLSLSPPMARRGIKPTFSKLISFRLVADTALNFKLTPSTAVWDPISPPKKNYGPRRHANVHFRPNGRGQGQARQHCHGSHLFPPRSLPPLLALDISIPLASNICIITGRLFSNPQVLTTRG